MISRSSWWSTEEPKIIIRYFTFEEKYLTC